MDTENQTETNGQETPVTEVSPGETELDTLLNEFNTAESVTKSDLQSVVKANQAVAKSFAPVIEYVNAEQEKKATDAFNKDVAEAVSFLTEPEDLKEIPADLAQGYLEVHAIKHPEFKAAFEGKAKNPDEWQTQLGKARDAFADLVKPFSVNTEQADVRTDVEHAVATVQGLTETPAEQVGPTIAEKANMSDQKWKEYTDSLPG